MSMLRCVVPRTTVAMLAAFVALWSAPAADAGQAAKIDVTGKWAFTVQTSAGSGTPTVTLKQDGNKVTGHYSSANLGEAELTGSVEDRNIEFSFMAEAQGVSFQVTYTGTVEDKDSMKGKVDLGGQAQGTFTAKRHSSGTNQASAVRPYVPYVEGSLVTVDPNEIHPEANQTTS